jgi:hypothetical protein
MSELSCDTLFIGRNETHDLSRYPLLLLSDASKSFTWYITCCVILQAFIKFCFFVSLQLKKHIMICAGGSCPHLQVVV